MDYAWKTRNSHILKAELLGVLVGLQIAKHWPLNHIELEIDWRLGSSFIVEATSFLIFQIY